MLRTETSKTRKELFDGYKHKYIVKFDSNIFTNIANITCAIHDTIIYCHTKKIYNDYCK